MATLNDTVVPIEGVRNLVDMFAKNMPDKLVKYMEIDGDHATPLLAEDDSFLDEIFQVIKQYNQNSNQKQEEKAKPSDKSELEMKIERI